MIFFLNIIISSIRRRVVERIELLIARPLIIIEIVISSFSELFNSVIRKAKFAEQFLLFNMLLFSDQSSSFNVSPIDSSDMEVYGQAQEMIQNEAKKGTKDILFKPGILDDFERALF